VGFLIIIVILGLAYVLLMLPARRRRQAHANMQDSVGLGDEVITAGGLHGHVRELDDESGTVRLEIAPQVVVTLDRRAVAAVAREVEVNADEDEVKAPENPSGTGEEPR
jgi:preprotein translocase subunit YajC